jgi:hypothetical protein
MIKPNLIASHDWHVQPICQRSLRAVRLSGALGIEAPTFTSGCPRTWCARPIFATDFFCLAASIAVFARTFQNYRSSASKSSSFSPILRSFETTALPRTAWGSFGLRTKTRRVWDSLDSIQEIRPKASRYAQISKIDRRKRARATKAHRG